MKLGFREMIFTSLMLGMVAGTYAMIVQPHASARSQQLEAIRSMDAELSAIGNSTQGMEALATRIDLQRRTLVQFGNMLPQESDAKKTIDEVLQTAAASSLEAGDVHVPKREQIDGLTMQPVTFTFSGNFNGFYSFLLQLEAMHRVMRTTQMNFHGGSDAAGQMQADITLLMFFDPGAGTVAQASYQTN